MSRTITRGIDPITKKEYEVAYGWDEIPGFKPGYFFQVFDLYDPDKIIVNEGYLNGITENRLNELKRKWKVK